MKYELRGQIMKEFVVLRTKTYIYLKDNINENKKAICKENVSFQIT